MTFLLACFRLASETRILEFEIPISALFFASPRFRDSCLRRRDFETRVKFAETHHFSRTILHPFLSQVVTTLCYEPSFFEVSQNVLARVVEFKTLLK